MSVLQFDVGLRFTIWGAFVGLRYTAIDAKGRFEEIDGLPDPNFSSTDNFLDPVVGIRAFVPLGDRWQVQAQGDIGGGFGATTWQAKANVGFRASDAISVWIGYRAFSVNFTGAGDERNLALDVVNQGPSIGVEVNF